MIYLLLDILIYNLTKYQSYFFLINLSNKDLLTNMIIALTIDLCIMHTFFLNTLIILGLYLIKKYLLKINLHNFITFLFYNLFNLGIYFLIMHIYFKGFYFKDLISVLIVNLIFIIISYKNQDKNINLIG